MRCLLFVFLTMLGLNVAQAACIGIHDFRFTTLEGSQVDLCEYRDRPILVVNTASKCGFTPQFEKLEAMHEKYHDKGLLLVGFPSNDFQQEPASNKEIGDFCKRNYGVQFPMAEKSSVVGPDANPLYKRLIEVTREPPLWNFHKYLVLPDGKVYAFSSDTSPESPDIMRRLQPFLR
jgi:glutathione peroxidase